MSFPIEEAEGKRAPWSHDDKIKTGKQGESKPLGEKNPWSKPKSK